MRPTTAIVQQSQELTQKEQQTLQACEQDITKGIELQAKALQTIRDKKLYRSEFDTFEDYVSDRLGKSRSWAYRQIDYIKVCQNIAESSLSPIGDISEAATREIADLEPDQQVEVVQEATKNGKKPTAKAVKEAKETVQGQSPQQQVREHFGDSQPAAPSRDEEREAAKAMLKNMETILHKVLRMADQIENSHPKSHGKFLHNLAECTDVIESWHETISVPF